MPGLYDGMQRLWQCFTWPEFSYLKSDFWCGAGNQAIRVIKMEQIYEKRMAEIAEAMKEGPLFKVATK